MAEDTSEIGGDVFNSSHNEEGVVETKDTVELQKGKGLPPVITTMATTREWSRIDDVQEFPTNAFGDIKFENEYNSTLKPAKVCYSIKILVMLITWHQIRVVGCCQTGT